MILGACCIVTAISLKQSISKKELLRYEAGKLQENLAFNEQIVYDFLKDSVQVERAKHYHLNDDYGLDFIEKYREKGIDILIYQNEKIEVLEFH